MANLPMILRLCVLAPTTAWIFALCADGGIRLNAMEIIQRPSSAHCDLALDTKGLFLCPSKSSYWFRVLLALPVGKVL